MYKLLITLIILLTSSVSLAKEPNMYITPYAGIFDIIRDNRKPLIGGELRFTQFHNYIVPKVGAFVTNKRSNYIYGGFNIEIPIYEKSFYIIPGFAVGAYGKHKGKNLGGTLEFYSTIEANYKLPNHHRVGVSFGHISNAHIYKKNPGEENLLLTYSLPISF